MDESCFDNPVESPSPVTQAAEDYLRRGWSVIPIPHQSKNPGFKGWEQLRVTPECFRHHFNGHPQNVGVLLGEPSGWLIDVDLDHPRAVDLASKFLPPTPAVFGRAGNPRSHWLYRVTSPAATKKYRSKSAGMIVEFRSTKMQTVFPPSTHESGERIEWESDGAEPATLAPEHLLECVRQLAQAVLVELGEKPAKASNAKRPQPPKEPDSDTSPVETTSADVRAARCLAAMLRMGLTDHRDGSLRLYTSACRVVEHDLDDMTALLVIREYARQKPFARTWTDEDILRRVRDAEQRCHRGAALEVDEAGLIALGNRDPQTGRLVLSPKRTLPTAQAFVGDFHVHPGGRTLQSHAGLIMEWRENRYVEVEDEAIRHRLQEWLHEALRYVVNRQTHEPELAPFESNPTSVNAALDSLRSYAFIPATLTSPSWLGKSADDPPASEILPCRSSLLHLPTMRHLDPTPRFFTTNSLEFDPVPDAPVPKCWFAFLHQLFDGDSESLDLLQEWFGYSLIADTSQQKMLLLVGPRRSGKGTIARVLTRLVGQGNVCGPTTSSLAGPFGLQPLLGKSLAIVSDARFGGENIATVVERLLCISGEDCLTVDRKFKTSVTMRLPLRFMFLSNEFPRLTDASGALAGRFLILRLTQSFYGKEDPDLTNRLLLELPSILNWAIEGWHRLRERGRFVLPQSVEHVVREIEDLSSPVGAFVRDECVVGPGHRVWLDDIYAAWKAWCEREGRTMAVSKQTFGRDLSAAVPGIVSRRNRIVGRFYEGIALADAAEVPSL
ncbi:MAG: bifunctional DNA primase/polymerase [Planctomycetaceae bacterium]|nr:bifunctional DNA primase/polymerase [Planctomycetaceae bacterium]